MKEKIPLEIKKLYQKANLKDRLYIRLRWRLCPYEKIEQYLPQAGLILDLGCGYGLLANLLAVKSAKSQVIGIDNSAKRLAVANLTIGNRPNIKLIQEDIQKMELPFCQAITMSDFLHHLPDKLIDEVLLKAYQSLDSGGRLIIEEVAERPFWKYLSNLFIDHLLYPGQKINFKPTAYWQKLLKEKGFRVETVSAHQGIPLADIIFICTKK